MPNYQTGMVIPTLDAEELYFLVEKVREGGYPMLFVRYEDVDFEDAQTRRDDLNVELASRSIETFPPLSYRRREAARR